MNVLGASELKCLGTVSCDAGCQRQDPLTRKFCACVPILFGSKLKNNNHCSFGLFHAICWTFQGEKSLAAMHI